jgi:histidinol-phosphate aminotransferase
MQRKLVRIANAMLDLEPYDMGQRRYPRLNDLRSGILKLDHNEATTGPSPAVIEAIKDFMTNRPMNWYPDPEAEELKIKISEYVSHPLDYISCYGGSDIALEHIARTYLEQGTEMVVNAPVCSNVQIAAKSTGAGVIEAFHPDPFNPGIETLVDFIGPRTRMIYISNPNDPTGALFSEAELVFLLAYAENVMIVVDETYFEYCGRSAVDLVKRFPNLAIVRSFSNGFGLASMGVGYIISDPQNLEFVRRIKTAYGISSVAQIASLAALENRDYTKEYIVAVDQSKKVLSNSLPEIGYDFKMTPANFFLLRISDPGEAAEFLAQEGILVRNLSGIRQMDGYLRITIGTPEQTDRLLLGLSRMAEKFATGFNRNRVSERADKSVTGLKEPISIE